MSDPNKIPMTAGEASSTISEFAAREGCMDPFRILLVMATGRHPYDDESPAVEKARDIMHRISEGGEGPSHAEWMSIAADILDDERFRTPVVPAHTAMAAAKAALDYAQKYKIADNQPGIKSHNTNHEVEELTDAEIKRIKKVFQNSF